MEGKAELSETHVNRARRIVGISHTHTQHTMIGRTLFLVTLLKHNSVYLS